MLRIIETNASQNGHLDRGQRAQDLCHGHDLICQVGISSRIVDVFSAEYFGLDLVFYRDQAEVDGSAVLQDGLPPKNATVVGFKAD